MMLHRHFLDSLILFQVDEKYTKSVVSPIEADEEDSVFAQIEAVSEGSSQIQSGQTEMIPVIDQVRGIWSWEQTL